MACPICGQQETFAFRKGSWSYVRCGQCGLLSSNPIPSAEQIEQHYRHKFIAGNYQTARHYASQYRRVHEQIADWIGPKKGERILDVGCFTGELLQVLQSRGADVYGIELQSEAVEIASERLPGRVYKADVHASEFPGGPYDAVAIMGVIEHVIEPVTLIRQAHCALVPGGKLFLQTPDSGSFFALAMRSHWPPLAPIEHIHLFTRKALRKMLHYSGFTDVRFSAHVKTLPVSYVYENLKNFGPEWRALLRPFSALLRDIPLPFYVGEMLVRAIRK